MLAFGLAALFATRQLLARIGCLEGTQSICSYCKRIRTHDRLLQRLASVNKSSSVICQPCPVCGETRPESFRVWFDDYVKLYRCLKCGFVSQFPGPGTSTIVTDYVDPYSMDFVNKGQEFLFPERGRVLRDIVDRVTKAKSSGRLLDVGCGDGHFLCLCSEEGFMCHGVETGKQLSAYAASKSGARVIYGAYSRDMFPEHHFDIITFIQVLEHMPTPVAALEMARYHLRPEGILVIEVPSVRSPHFLAYRWTGIRRFVRPPYGVIYSHCGYYSPRSLTTLTDRCGFTRLSLVTGRWQYKYSGFLGQVGKVIDPLLNMSGIGGILLIAQPRLTGGR